MKIRRLCIALLLVAAVADNAIAVTAPKAVNIGSDGERQKPVVRVAVGCRDKSVTSVEIPAGVTKIGNGAFYGCKALAAVVIPAGVTEIDGSAFDGCKSLTSVVIPNSVTEIGRGAFDSCTSLVSVVIPENVTKIGYYAFFGCKALASVVIGAGVTEIDVNAFSDCKALASVEFGGTVAQWEAVKGKDNLFNGYVHATSVKCADGVWQKPVVLVEDGVAVECLDKSVTSVVIGASVTKIGNGAFYGCKALAAVVIPAGVTAIGWSAFKGCLALASVVIPAGVTEIGESAFLECWALTSVEFGGTVAQWKAVEKEPGWHKGVPAKSVKCADGEARL